MSEQWFGRVNPKFLWRRTFERIAKNFGKVRNTCPIKLQVFETLWSQPRRKYAGRSKDEKQTRNRPGYVGMRSYWHLASQSKGGGNICPLDSRQRSSGHKEHLKINTERTNGEGGNGRGLGQTGPRKTYRCQWNHEKVFNIPIVEYRWAHSGETASRPQAGKWQAHV